MKKTTNSSPYQFEGRIPLSQAIPLGLQHVMAMFIGNLTPLIIVMGACMEPDCFLFKAITASCWIIRSFTFFRP